MSASSILMGGGHRADPLSSDDGSETRVTPPQVSFEPKEDLASSGISLAAKLTPETNKNRRNDARH
jgi:hypothetical protein